MNENFLYDIGQAVWIVSEELSTVLECKVLQVSIKLIQDVRDVKYNLISGHNTVQENEANIYGTFQDALDALALLLG